MSNINCYTNSIDYSNSVKNIKHDKYGLFLNVFSVILLFVSNGSHYYLIYYVFVFLYFLLKDYSVSDFIVYILLGGVVLIGFFSQYYGYAAKVSLILNPIMILLALFYKKNNYLWKNIKISAIYIQIVFLIIFVSYLYGPLTAESTEKIIYMFLYGVVCFFAYVLIINDEGISFEKLAYLFIYTALIMFVFIKSMIPSLMGESIFMPGAIKLLYNNIYNYLSFDGNVISVIVLYGVAFYFGFIVRVVSFGGWLNNYLLNMLSVLFLSIIISNFIGQRFYLVMIAVILIISYFICKNRAMKKYILILFVGSVAGFSYLVNYGIENNLLYIMNVMYGNDIGETLNRSQNWSSAINRISESPLYGYGLGGYWVDNYSVSGSGTYAHNIILELLSEMGIVLTCIMMYLIVGSIKKINKRGFISSSGSSIILIFVYLIMQSMVNYDLRINISLIVLLIILGHLIRRDRIYKQVRIC